MKLLVFGKTGQVARALKVRCPDARFLDRSEADLTDPEACAALITASDADAVINAAAYTDVDGAETDEATAFLVNAEAPAAMARAAAAKGIPFVTVSTDYVFDGQGDKPKSPDDRVAPLNAYGRSKYAGEQAVAAVGGAYAILRTSWVFSATGANFATAMLRLSETRDRLDIVADQVGGPTPAADIADALITIAEALAADRTLAGLYHYSGSPDVNRADFTREIFRQAGRDVTIADVDTSHFPTPAERPLNSRLDCSATIAAFGLARPDWRAGLATVLEQLGARP